MVQAEFKLRIDGNQRPVLQPPAVEQCRINFGISDGPLADQSIRLAEPVREPEQSHGSRSRLENAPLPQLIDVVAPEFVTAATPVEEFAGFEFLAMTEKEPNNLVATIEQGPIPNARGSKWDRVISLISPHLLRRQHPPIFNTNHRMGRGEFPKSPNTTLGNRPHRLW